MYLSVDRTTCNDMGGFYPYAVRETGPDFLFVDLYAAHAACKTFGLHLPWPDELQKLENLQR